MKNKKSEQIAAKERHRELIKAKRRSQPDFERPEPKIVEKPTILIVCEGENTEPSYFNQFRLSSAKVIPMGEGFNTVSLVRRALVLNEMEKYDQVWCVFDADPKPDNPNQATNFNSAIQIADANGFGVAYSNQAFEYWIILHFNDHQGGAMDRSSYDDKINKLLNPFNVTFDGKGNKIITEEIFEILDGIDEKTGVERKQLAIRRAERNYNQLNHFNPAIEESSTTVFKLVEELLKYI